MIDLTNESPLTIEEAARLIPGRAGRHTNFSTVFRWVTKGIVSPTGEKVQLRAARAGAKWITSREALQEFLNALTPDLQNVAPEVRTPAARERASKRARRELADMGI
jgi:hypothetical protein